MKHLLTFTALLLLTFAPTELYAQRGLIKGLSKMTSKTAVVGKEFQASKITSISNGIGYGALRTSAATIKSPSGHAPWRPCVVPISLDSTMLECPRFMPNTQLNRLSVVGAYRIHSDSLKRDPEKRLKNQQSAQ